MLYVFGDCALDTSLYALSRAGRTIRLRPKVFQLLIYLVTHRERVVSRQELCAQVWPGQYISDAALESVIRATRQALGDSGREQQCIQTLHGHGYRFIATVTVRSDAGLDSAAAVAPPLPAPATPPAQDRADALPPSGLPAESAGAAAASLPDAAPRLPASEMLAGERKLVTMLGCTLDYDPALRERLGLDGLHSLQHRLYALARREIQQYGGTLHHTAGDQFLAVFGAPVAQEDHARRALLAACGLLQRVSLAARPGDALAVRLALHTGLLVVGGSGEEQGPASVVGDLPDTVAALQDRAEPQTILCSEATGRLVRWDVPLEEVRPLPVPGRQTALRVYKVLTGRPQDVAVEPQARWGESRFVGRARELATLHALLAQVEAGRGQVVGIVGEPGIGKSRLLAEFHRSLEGRPLLSLSGRCLAYGQATPYHPVLDLLRSALGITMADGPTAISAKVRCGLQEVGIAADEAAALLLALLGVDVGREPLAALPPETRQARTFTTLVQWCVHQSQQRPLLLDIEDLHWSDATSDAWLATLVERLARLPIFVVGTYRPGYRPLWLDKSYATQMALPPLSPQDSLEVLHTVIPPAHLPAAVAQEILTKAEGSPFFLEELARMAVGQETAPLPLGIPETIQAVLAARIDGLPAEAKHLLQTAAVIGMHTTVSLLQAVTGWADATLHTGLQHLQATEFLYETWEEPEQTYTFRHALIQEVAYESLLQEGRRALHARIVEALETLASDRVGALVDLLAHHALRGAVWAKALVYCRQAGDTALERSAHREAVGYFEQALSTLPHLQEQRDTLAPAIDLRLALRNALWTLGELEGLFVHLQAAAELAEVLADQRRLGWVSVYLLAHFAQVGDPDRALMSGQRALAIATALEDRDITVVAQHYLGGVYRSLGDYQRAVACFQTNVACLHGALLQERFGLPGLAAVFARSHLVVSLAECGAFTAARAPAEEAVRMAEAADHPYSRVMAYWAVGVRALRQGDLAQAVPVLTQALDLAQGAHLRLLVPVVAAPLGMTYALAGRSTDALPLLEQAVAQAIAMQYLWDQALRLVWLSEAYLLAGRLDEADTEAQRALAFSRVHQERGHEAYALRLLGEIAARRDPPQVEPAVTHYEQARALAEALGMRPLAAHCHLGLGTLYAQTSQREQARSALSTAMALYRALDMTFWLPQATAALAQVEVRGTSEESLRMRPQLGQNALSLHSRTRSTDPPKTA